MSREGGSTDTATTSEDPRCLPGTMRPLYSSGRPWSYQGYWLPLGRCLPSAGSGKGRAQCTMGAPGGAGGLPTLQGMALLSPCCSQQFCTSGCTCPPSHLHLHTTDTGALPPTSALHTTDPGAPFPQGNLILDCCGPGVLSAHNSHGLGHVMGSAWQRLSVLQQQ